MSDGDVTSLLAELVAMPTVSERDNGELLEWLRTHLGDLGARVHVHPGAHGRANLIATLGPSGPGGLVLAGHTDVVPAGEGWMTDPWTLTADGDRLFGRGTADMKGFFAAVVVALARVERDNLIAPVHVLASYDEEIGCRGVRDILPTLHDRSEFAPALVVVGEPTMMRPRHAHLGKQTLRVEVTAAAAHSSRAGTVPSAITHAGRLVGVLDEILQRRPPVADGDSPPYTVNCGTISGGSQVNVIAERCTLVLEVRHDTNHTPEELLAPLWRAIEDGRCDLAGIAGGGIEVTELARYPALSTDSSAPAFRIAERLADAGPSTAIGFGSEGGLYAEALEAPVMICGPGDIDHAHRPDEYVTVDQLRRCVAFTETLVTKLCCASGDEAP